MRLLTYNVALFFIMLAVITTSCGSPEPTPVAATHSSSIPVVQTPDIIIDLGEMRNEIKTTHKLDKPHLMRLKKRERARVLTALNQQAKG